MKIKELLMDTVPFITITPDKPIEAEIYGEDKKKYKDYKAVFQLPNNPVSSYTIGELALTKRYIKLLDKYMVLYKANLTNVEEICLTDQKMDFFMPLHWFIEISKKLDRQILTVTDTYNRKWQVIEVYDTEDELYDNMVKYENTFTIEHLSTLLTHRRLKESILKQEN